MFLINLVWPRMPSTLILLIGALIVLAAVCEAKTKSRANLTKSTSAAPAPSPNAEVLTEPRVVVSDNHPVLTDEHPYLITQALSGIWSKLSRRVAPDQYSWTCFSIHPKSSSNPAGQQPNAIEKPITVNISAMGLGSTAFAIPDQNGCAGVSKTQGPSQMCQLFSGTGGGWTNGFGCWQSVLTLTLDQQKVVGVRIPVGLVKQPGTAIEGKLIIDEASHKLLEVPVKIERPSDPFSTGFQWFLGIVIPALLTFIIGYITFKLNAKVTSRLEQKKAFSAFKDEQYSVLDTFFTNFYNGVYDSQEVKSDPKSLFRELRNEMRAKKILSSIPQKERNKVEQAFRLCQEDQLHRSLSLLFDEWRDSIESRKLKQAGEKHD